MFTVCGMSDSGNCHKVRLVPEQLALPYRWVGVDAARGGTRSPRFLPVNGQIAAFPVELQPILDIHPCARSSLSFSPSFPVLRTPG